MFWTLLHADLQLHNAASDRRNGLGVVVVATCDLCGHPHQQQRRAHECMDRQRRVGDIHRRGLCDQLNSAALLLHSAAEPEVRMHVRQLWQQAMLSSGRVRRSSGLCVICKQDGKFAARDQSDQTRVCCRRAGQRTHNDGGERFIARLRSVFIYFLVLFLFFLFSFFSILILCLTLRYSIIRTSLSCVWRFVIP